MSLDCAGGALATSLALAAGALLTALLVLRLRGALPSHRRLAAREDANGRALLELADELDACASRMQVDGATARACRDGSRLCRRVAVEHLECINRLMLDEHRRKTTRDAQPPRR